MIRAIVLAIAMIALPTLAAAGSPFAGSWRGRWTDPMLSQTGPVAFDVDASGTVDGHIGNDNYSLQGTISGRIAEDGTTDLTYSYDGGATHGIAKGSMRRTDGALTGKVEFSTPDGRSLGNGLFRLAPNEVRLLPPAWSASQPSQV